MEKSPPQSDFYLTICHYIVCVFRYTHSTQRVSKGFIVILVYYSEICNYNLYITAQLIVLKANY